MSPTGPRARIAIRASALVLLLNGNLARAQSDWVIEHGPIIGATVGAGMILNLHFTTFAIRGERPTHNGAIVEVALTVPQAAALVWAGTSDPVNRGTTTRLLLLCASAWPAALAVHGIWSLSTEPSARSYPGQRAQATLVPSLVGDGERLGVGFAVVGQF
jgi:hypothetical protein